MAFSLQKILLIAPLVVSGVKSNVGPERGEQHPGITLMAPPDPGAPK
jgi:hypothetical protein